MIDDSLYACVDSNCASPTDSTAANTALARSVSGIVCMLARVCVDGGATRQHLAAPDVHSAEVNAAGTGLQRVSVLAEMLREMSIPTGAVPIYVDSESTLLVANNERSVKRSVWTIRRVIVLQEAVAHELAAVRKIDEADNLADLLTKYLKFVRWRRHIDIIMNYSGTRRPPVDWRL